MRVYVLVSPAGLTPPSVNHAAYYHAEAANNMGLYRFRRGIDWREKRAGVPAPENAENNLFAKPNYALAA